MSFYAGEVREPQGKKNESSDKIKLQIEKRDQNGNKEIESKKDYMTQTVYRI